MKQKRRSLTGSTAGGAPLPTAPKLPTRRKIVEAADFQQARTYRYLASGGTEDIGGFEYGFGEATNKGDF